MRPHITLSQSSLQIFVSLVNILLVPSILHRFCVVKIHTPPDSPSSRFSFVMILLLLTSSRFSSFFALCRARID
jgi:hypothetical protein